MHTGKRIPPNLLRERSIKESAGAIAGQALRCHLWDLAPGTLLKDFGTQDLAANPA
jgi:hypothetical protein